MINNRELQGIPLSGFFSDNETYRSTPSPWCVSDMILTCACQKYIVNPYIFVCLSLLKWAGCMVWNPFKSSEELVDSMRGTGQASTSSSIYLMSCTHGRAIWQSTTIANVWVYAAFSDVWMRSTMLNQTPTRLHSSGDSGWETRWWLNGKCACLMLHGFEWSYECRVKWTSNTFTLIHAMMT